MLAPSTQTSRRCRDPERGSILMVSMIALVALLGIGIVTLLSVRSDTAASGNDRFQQIALYAAESGAAAGLDFLRQNCNTSSFYTPFVSPANSAPLSPAEITGNNVAPGDTGNPFDITTRASYKVTILNNTDDSGFVTGVDLDGIVVLQVVGYGPSNTQATLNLSVQSPSCIAAFCATDYAQRGVNALNSYQGMCANAVDLTAGLRVVTP